MVSFNACLALACLRWLNSAEGRMHHVRLPSRLKPPRAEETAEETADALTG
jgi:hypothetical protein